MRFQYLLHMRKVKPKMHVQLQVPSIETPDSALDKSVLLFTVK